MAKKKTLNLSELKNYTIKDDLSENKQEYGFGSWLKQNAVPLLQTGAGAALTATGVGSAAGIGLMASGASGLASNNLTDDPETAAAIQGAGQVAGTVGGSIAQAQMANGGPMNYNSGGMVNNNGLTEYNGGGTHEENPRGGIDVGPNAQVEANETRWEDYIFSDRLKVPGSKSKATFADMSKKIKDKYSQRKNDSFDKKAMEREMKALMAMQESERERMDIKHKQTMDELFACGGKMKHQEGGELVDATQASNAINITPGTEVPNVYQLTPRQSDLRAQYDYLKDYTPTFSEDKTTLVGDDDVSKRKRELDAQEVAYRKQFAPLLGAPVYDRNTALVEARKAYKDYDTLDPMQKREIISGYVGLPNFSEVDPNTIYDTSKLPAEDLKNFYSILREKQAIRDAQGFKRKQYYGDKEAAQKGYDENTPLEDLNFGIRFLTGAQNPQIYSQKAYGGKVQYGGGSGLDLNLDAFNAANNAINPNIGPLAAGAGPMGTLSDQVMDLNKYYDPNSIPMQDNTDYTSAPNPGNTSYSSTGMGMGLNPAALKAAADAANLENQSAVGGTSDAPGKFGIKDAAVLGLQNMGNLYNLFQGMQGPEDVQFDRVDPNKVDYSRSIADARRAYEQAGSIARRNIGRTATSSGQALSALIAQEAALDRNKGQAIRSAMEGQENTNAQITNQAESQNAQISMEQKIANEKNKAASDMSTQLGLTGIGQSIAGFNRDRLGYAAQERALANMGTQNYEVAGYDENGKAIIKYKG